MILQLPKGLKNPSFLKVEYYNLTIRRAFYLEILGGYIEAC
jgi:hypothetical protein